MNILEIGFNDKGLIIKYELFVGSGMIEYINIPKEIFIEGYKRFIVGEIYGKEKI